MLCLNIVKRTDRRVHLIFCFVDIAIFSFIQTTIVLRLLFQCFLGFFVAVAIVLLRTFLRFIEMSVCDLWGWCDLGVTLVHDILEGSQSVVDEIKVQ